MDKMPHSSFNEKKALNAILYITNKLKRKDFHKIFKIIYFSDREHLSKYGRTITGDLFIAMDDGPVPSKIYDIFKSIRGDGYFKDNGHFSEYFEVYDWDLVKPIKEANLKTLSKTDIEIIDTSLKDYGDLTWEEIREKSHDYAWKNTVPNSPIKMENIILENGDDEEYIEYLLEQAVISDGFR